MKKEFVIFGTGKWGKAALKEIGEDKVYCFIDNDVTKHNTEYEAIPIVSLKDYLLLKKDYKIIVAVSKSKEIIVQLEDEKITNYEIWINKKAGYGDKECLVVNRYDKSSDCTSEEEWIEKTELEYTVRKYINDESKKCLDNLKLFNHIEIETYNCCNGTCEFCPVSVGNDTREKIHMSPDLFRKIIDELSALDYSGKVALFSNNEPFLDDRIIEFHKYAKNNLPKARFHLFTNGTKLTLEKFLEIIPYVDDLIIDNYNQNLKLIPPVKIIKEYCEQNPELIQKVTIWMRKPKEIMTTRGGSAPNRLVKNEYKDSCLLPFKQIIVRPDGKVSLCCNDSLGKCTLGDLTQESLEDVWYGDKFTEIRKRLVAGRHKIDSCRYCDTFLIG